MLVIAHRGASSSAPENTVPAMRLALDADADGVEFDVRLTADGTAVVIHDDDVARTTNGTGSVSSMSFSQVRMLDAGVGHPGYAGTPIPSLEEVLAVVDGRVRVVLELKGAHRADGSWGAREVLEAVAERARDVHDLTLTSFDPEVLAAAHELVPGRPTALAGYRTAEEEWMLRVAATEGHAAVSIPAAQTDEAFVALAHARAVQVYSWDAPAQDAGRLAAMGVDAMITADPARARALLAG